MEACWIFTVLAHIFYGIILPNVSLYIIKSLTKPRCSFYNRQIFEIYQAIPNASLEKMNDLIRKAVNICTGVYIFVGGFGYIAFCRETFTGNILMSFPSSLMSEVIKIGFVLSVAFSFPLIIFPCRASLYSLLYKRVSHRNSNLKNPKWLISSCRPMHYTREELINTFQKVDLKVSHF